MEISRLLMRGVLPKKELFYRSEVADLLNVRLDQILAWEIEFPQIRSKKMNNGQRLYERDDVLLFTTIRYLVVEKKLSVPLALKSIAESDALKVSSDPGMISAANEELTMISDALDPEIDTLLWDSSKLLPDEDTEFDETAHEIYQECKSGIEEATVVVEAKEVGDMLADALLARREQDELKRREYEEVHAALIAKKESLNDLLGSLEKYEPSALSQRFIVRLI